MLKIKSLSKHFGGVKAVDNCSFEIQKGKITALIGPNGCGKSTLLKSIFNLAKTYSGDLIYKNKNIKNLKTFKLIREGICFVPQGRQVFNDLSIKENLEMGAFILKDKELIKNKNALSSG